MAEFIFDLQRFDSSEGSKGGSSSDSRGGSGGSGGNNSYTGYSNTGHTLFGTNGGSGYSNTGHTQSGANVGSGSGWEPRIRKAGEIIFPLFMDMVTANSFANAAWSNYVDTFINYPELVFQYDFKDNIIDTIGVSRLNHTYMQNDAYDVINLTDATVGNLVEYFTFSDTDKSLALVFDTGAVLEFNIDVVSPVFNFVNGESMMYSAIEDEWLTGNEMTAEHDFWATAFRYSGTGIVDNFAVTQTVNTGLLDVGGADTIYLYDVLNLYDVLDVVDDNSITLVFPTGGALVVENSSTYSPDFIFADGSSKYYNRELDEWRDSSLKASDAAESYAAYEQAAYAAGFTTVCDASLYTDNMFPVTSFASTLVYDTDSYDKIYFQDAVYENVELMTTSEDDSKSYIDIVFDTGAVTRIGYLQNFSPALVFADGQTMGYDARTDTFSTAYATDGENVNEVALTVWDNSLVYQAGDEDIIYFPDGSVANIVDVRANDYYIDFTFNTGTTTSIRYTDEYSPDFIFGGDPSTHYHYNYLDGWSSGTTFYSGINYADQITLSRGANLFVYDTTAADTIYFPDATLGNILNVSSNGYDIKFLFDTGAATEVRYSGTTSPTFILAEGVPWHYDALTAEWNIGSADLAESADLWGDVAPADDLLTGGTIASDATLSDLVAPVADVTSFNAGNAFDAQSTGEFVVVAADSSQKTA